MSNKYIVRQPIKDADGKTIAYEILYNGDNQAFSNDKNFDIDSVGDTVYRFLMQNTDTLFKGTKSFMTFTPTLLIRKTPKLFNTSDLVIQIDDSVMIHPLAMHILQQYSKAGYEIAVNEFQFAPRYLALMDSIQFIKLDFNASSDAALRNVLELAHNMKKKCIAVNIENQDQYDRAKQFGADALEGPFIAGRFEVKTHTSSYLESNFFQLMVAVTKEEPRMEEIEEIIGRDAGLTYALMRMANSLYFATHNRATTIRQAIVKLGLSQLKEWIYLLSTSSAGGDIDAATEEFLKFSFMRANFCSDLMNYAKNMPITKNEAYLMGMFSTLNYLIDAPMKEILEAIPISNEVREALLNHTGRCGILFDLALSYEQANWNRMTELAGKLEIPTHRLTQVYFNCMEHVNAVWRQLTVTNNFDDGNDENDDTELISN